MQSSHPKIFNNPPSMGPPSTSSSAPPHSTLKHQKTHPTAKTLKPNPPTPKSAVTAKMPPLSNDIIPSPPQVRKKTLTYKETKTTGNKYIAKNV
jgi:hypothetical protein